MEVCVGDILSFENSSFFSADLILLASSEPQGMCYKETANLDGETNLNIRSVLICTSGMTYPIDLARMAGHTGAEQSNRHLYEFAGNTVLIVDYNIWKLLAVFTLSNPRVRTLLK